MAGKSSYELYHQFPRLAEESGFAFNIPRPRGHIDWNKFRLIDIESLIRERKFTLIEQHLNDILLCSLETEFDVRILDEGVVKMFRLAQLAIEYQQFCRHYLDRSVYVLKEEITALAQELDETKKDIRNRDDEIRKLKRKTRHNFRAPSMPYGNDNIAAMILKTLANKSNIFQSTSNGDALQYNKCSYCDKVFLNQLYLQSHLSRRHPHVTEIPQRDIQGNVQTKSAEQDNLKLDNEIMELKSKLNEMEAQIIQANNQPSTHTKAELVEVKNNTDISEKKTKDVEVSTSNEDFLLDKIEEWKKLEHEKYNKEINLLRTQILETLNSLKENEVKKPVQNDLNTNLIEQLHATIKQQGAEILLLKQELTDSKIKSQNEEAERKREAEVQMLHWTKRTEAQTKQYELLLQKLNEVAQEARESRAIAETERERAAQLQNLLQQSLNNQAAGDFIRHQNHDKELPKRTNTTEDPYKSKLKKKSQAKNIVADSRTLERLHRKAQELLNIRSTDSSSDISSENLEKQTKNSTPNKTQDIKSKQAEKNHKVSKENKHSNKQPFQSQLSNTNDGVISKRKLKKNGMKSRNNVSEKIGNGVLIAPGSPMKLVRAKLTEEVNNRLVSAGVDPLKSRIPRQVFQKHRMQLQQIHDIKTKKNPEYQKIRHSIVAFLDSTTTSKKKEIIETQDYTSPTKLSKMFSLTNVISNVKSKALSFVKSSDPVMSAKRKTLNAEVAKKAMSLLKTPPDSVNTSPVIQRKIIEPKIQSSPHELKTIMSHQNMSNKETKLRKYNGRIKEMGKSPAVEIKNDTDDDSSEDGSDHKYYAVQQTSKSIESLIKSPARRPSSATADYSTSVRKYLLDSEPSIVRTQSEGNLSKHQKDLNDKRNFQQQNQNNNSDDVETSEHSAGKKAISKETFEDKNIPKQTRGVLKNASSASSLNKKKVLFDMDAIQMKSVSASPSQSTTEKSDNNENFELGLVNLDGEEWDISSIENEPLKNDTKIQINTRTSPKIEELKQTIESQLARRSNTPTTALVGGINLMPTPMARTSSIGGSNTSLGSSILDESEDMPPVVNHKAFVKPKKVTEKYDSEVDVSDYSLDGGNIKQGNDSF